MTVNIRENLAELGFNKNEIGVYLALAKLGEAKASQVAKAAELPRTTAINILNKMASENYVSTHVYKGVMSYWIESPQVLIDILRNKIEIADKLKDAMSVVYRVGGRFPNAQIFDTKKNIRNFIEKVLNGLPKGAVIYTIETPNEGNYRKIFSEGLEEIIFSVKNKRGIATKTLVPCGTFSLIEKHKLTRQNIEIREMPEHSNFSGSLWIIKDMLINFSGNPPFLVMSRHEAITKGMKELYDFLWRISK
ncbi:MAG: helix-turn-helix domain-containing protein [Parcubacteria group bacterium]